VVLDKFKEYSKRVVGGAYVRLEFNIEEDIGFEVWGLA